MVKSRGLRADEFFKDEILKIKIERINRGLDRNLQSDRRITKAITRTSFWPAIKEVLINSPLEDDRSRTKRRTRIKTRVRK